MLFFFLIESYFAGKCYKASSSKSLNQALESIVQKIQWGIVVNFEKIGGPEVVNPVEGIVRNISSFFCINITFLFCNKRYNIIKTLASKQE